MLNREERKELRAEMIEEFRVMDEEHPERLSMQAEAYGLSIERIRELRTELINQVCGGAAPGTVRGSKGAAS